MKLFRRAARQNLEDETLSALLTEAYDARLDEITSGSASEAFPLRGRCPSARTEADEGSNAVSIHSASVRRVRWQSAVAAILIMTALGAGGWLLSRSLNASKPAGNPVKEPVGQPSEELENCHPAELAGETVYLLDEDFHGEYHLQILNKLTSVLPWDFSELPEGMARRTVLSYEEYADYCSEWGLDQAYEEAGRYYLVYTWNLISPSFREDDTVRLVDVTRTDASIGVWLWQNKTKENTCYRALADWMLFLTVPVDWAADSVEIYDVMNKEDYAVELFAENEALENSADGTVRITGCATGYPSVDEKHTLLLLGSTPERNMLLYVDNQTEMVRPDGTEISRSEIPAVGAFVCFKAEGCVQTDRPPEEESIPNAVWYYAGKMTVYSADEAETAFAALQPSFAALSLTEIRDRVRNPETYRDEIRSEDWAGCVHKSALFDYGTGYLYAIWDTYDKHLYGAWLFDRNLTLRETAAGWTVELPLDGELKQTLESLTANEAEAQYGKFLYDGGSGLYLPTWFTSDGRLIVVNDTVPLHLVSSEDVLTPVRSGAEPAVPD